MSDLGLLIFQSIVYVAIFNTIFPNEFGMASIHDSSFGQGHDTEENILHPDQPFLRLTILPPSNLNSHRIGDKPIKLSSASIYNEFSTHTHLPSPKAVSPASSNRSDSVPEFKLPNTQLKLTVAPAMDSSDLE